MRRAVMVVSVLVCALIARAEGPEGDAPLVAGVGSITMTVSDLDRSIAFYTQVLGFELQGTEERQGDTWSRLLGVEHARTRLAMLRLGEERIQLLDFLEPEGRGIPADARSNDGWFQHIAIAVADMDRAYQRLSSRGVTAASISPQTLPEWNANAGGIAAFYFKDPDGHILEVIDFPPGKGDPRWAAERAEGDRLFLGVDHTAIVTTDTDRALAWYRGVLGMRIAGQSENYGIEQERLNNVFGARLRITTLRAMSGPGIELLEYITPRTGRVLPQDSTANDLWHWHIELRLTPGVELAACEGAIRAARAVQVSAAPRSPDEPLRGLMVRDPDGHALLLSGEVREAAPTQR
jgi:catechol 2,3-dioxygenase-like lactoylglutathione lyase family enzyme